MSGLARNASGPRPVRAPRAAPAPSSKQPNLAKLLSERLTISEPAAQEREQKDLPTAMKPAGDKKANNEKEEKDEKKEGVWWQQGGRGAGDKEEEEEEEEHPPWCNCSGIGTEDDPLLWKLWR